MVFGVFFAAYSASASAVAISSCVRVGVRISRFVRTVLPSVCLVYCFLMFLSCVISFSWGGMVIFCCSKHMVSHV